MLGRSDRSTLLGDVDGQREMTKPGLTTLAPRNFVEPEGLIGREREQEELLAALAAVAGGRGGFLLLAGEAGVGKTRLAREALARSGLLTLEASAAREDTPPYGPLVASLRAYLRVVPGGLDDAGPLSPYLAVILPEVGVPPERADRPTLFEAIRCAFSTIARRQPTAVLLDDLHWADDTTFELLPVLAETLEQEALLLVGAYRSDEVPRGHALRRMRTDLRRAGRLVELVVDPLSAEETFALAARTLGRPPSASLATTLYLRTQGIPLFVEELVRALASDGRLEDGPRGLEVTGAEALPIPETVRDAVLLRVETLSTEARQALDVASIAGPRFDLEVVSALADSTGLEEVFEAGFLVEAELGQGAFRHALVQEALHEAVPWRRRRRLHGEVASRLETAGVASVALAEHWLMAGEIERARGVLVAAARAWCGLHAYRDAAAAARRALELWPEGADESNRLAVLDQLGECAELSGDFGEAARAWREAADGHTLAEDARAAADVHRRLAGLYELRCSWDNAFASRAAAADGFRMSGLLGEAAAERLAAAANLQSAGSLTPALELVALAVREADEAGRRDLKARLLGLEGLVRARLGDSETGLDLARAGLSLALEDNLTVPAAEVYERIGMILENSSKYRQAIDAWTTGFDYCEAHGVSAKAHLCLVCMAYVLRKTGQWNRAIEVCRKVLAADNPPRAARCAAVGQMGLVHVLRGEVKRGRALLAESFGLAQRIEFMIMKTDAAYGLARADELEQEYESAAARCRLLLEFAHTGEDNHYPVASLRWASTIFARQGAAGEAGACAELLARSAAQSGNAETLAALAHALGEIALLNEEPEQAATQFMQALELLREFELPLERAETQLRAGETLVAAGEREAGIEHLIAAYRIGRKLGARPLAAQAADALTRLGEQLDRRLGKQAAAALERGGLSRRELEIIRLVAAGRTNREIARDLFLSPRTVDMHVRNILRKLDCRSRADATRKAIELGLLR
jgi:DNA-binding CsgD family transcriptional regulator